jgi:hypothetical protein
MLLKRLPMTGRQPLWSPGMTCPPSGGHVIPSTALVPSIISASAFGTPLFGHLPPSAMLFHQSYWHLIRNLSKKIEIILQRFFQ